MPSRASLQETIQLSGDHDRTITKQLGGSWLELAEVAKQWETWLELGEHLSLIKFKPTRAKWVDKRFPTLTKLKTLVRVGLSWEYRLDQGTGELTYVQSGSSHLLRKARGRALCFPLRWRLDHPLRPPKHDWRSTADFSARKLCVSVYAIILFWLLHLFQGVHYPHQHSVDTPVCLPPRRRSYLVLWNHNLTIQ